MGNIRPAKVEKRPPVREVISLSNKKSGRARNSVNFMEDTQYDDVEEKDTLGDSSTSEETDSTDGEGNSEENQSAALELLSLNKSVEGLRGEKEKLEKELGGLRRERRVIRSSEQTADAPKTEEDKSVEQKKEEPKTDLQMFKRSQREKARRTFIARHPEYGDKDADTKFGMLENTYGRVKQLSDMDSDDILEDMETAWAVVHRDEILKKSRELKREQVGDEIAVADLAASSQSGGVPGQSVKATASDVRSAKIAGMPLDKYLKLKDQYEHQNFSL